MERGRIVFIGRQEKLMSVIAGLLEDVETIILKYDPLEGIENKTGQILRNSDWVVLDCTDMYSPGRQLVSKVREIYDGEQLIALNHNLNNNFSNEENNSEVNYQFTLDNILIELENLLQAKASND